MLLHQTRKAKRMEADIPLGSCLYHKNRTFSVFPEKYGFQNRQEQTGLSGPEVLNNSISQTCTLFYAMLMEKDTKLFCFMENVWLITKKRKNTVFSLHAITSDLFTCIVLDSCHFCSSQETLFWFTDFCFALESRTSPDTWIRSMNECWCLEQNSMAKSKVGF